MKTFRWSLLTLLGLATGVLSVPVNAQQPTPRALFRHIKLAKPPADTDLRGMLEYQPVNIRWEVLNALRAGDRVELNLFKGYSLVAYIERVERRSERSVSYFGKIDGVDDGYSHVILTNEGEVLLATIYNPPLDIEFGVTSHREGYHLVYRVDPAVRGGCGTTVEPTPEPSRAEPKTPDESQSGGDFSPAGDFEPAACVQPIATVDIMVVYTPAIRAVRGSHDAVRAAAQLAVDVSNIIYLNSRIPLRARLVLVSEVNYDESGATFETHCNRLRDNGDGYMDIVHTWRALYRADDVALFVADDDDGRLCGRAFPNHGNFWTGPVADRAFFVLDARTNNCIALGWAAFTHELGHNQGCAHNRANAGCSCSIICGECTNRYDYSYGYRFQGADGQRYITVMSYATNDGDCTGSDYSGAPQIPFFSNPNITYVGVAIGRPEGDGCAADNARTIRNTARGRENFALLDIWVDFGYSGTERGTFPEPYNTVAEGANAITSYVDTTLIPFPILYIKAGSRYETITINKRMRIEACGGTVRIGAP
ncbi:MAG: hypothetical protein KatS3mg019_0334 [Fimbriimonadales bacterium]|nr:MAG: hypothetical protein KatS3mg019_0334 [Fimbriimonadales bacterium]